jgi:hypothetical protein
MAPITMWTHGTRRCVYGDGENAPMMLRLIDATDILREQIVGPNAAEVLAELGEASDTQTHSAWNDANQHALT